MLLSGRSGVEVATDAGLRVNVSGVFLDILGCHWQRVRRS
jgi:hypothetical protein